MTACDLKRADAETPGLTSVALTLLVQGHTPVPLRDKVPTIPWKRLQTDDASRSEVADWFGPPEVNGVGIMHKRGVAARDSLLGSSGTASKRTRSSPIT